MALDKLVDSTQLNTDLTSVANAIRSKSGGSGTMAFPSGFVSAIQNIPTGGGGGGSTDGDVIFIDYDGTIVDAKTKTEINAMSSDSDLPANPSHTGLTAQGWNWTVAQLKAQLTATPNQKIYVGQMYVTTSGDTEIDVEMTEGRLSPIMTIAVKGTITVDWGDNTTPNTVTGTSLTTRLAVGPHNYATPGSYTIKISVSTGKFSFYCSSSYYLFRKNTTTNESRVYTNCIKRVRLGTGIDTLYSYSFYYCTSLDSISIPSGITSIGSNVFYGCYSLFSVSIPSSVKTINGSAFQNCYSLSSISIPSGVTSISASAFYNCYSLSSISIPSGVTGIGNSTFSTCQSLASISIPSSATSIGASAFFNCYSISSSISIPSGVTSIGNSAFTGCYGASEYHLHSTTPPTLGTTVFSSIPSDCIIYVPYSADHSILNTYKTASNWSTYASYMQEEPA